MATAPRGILLSLGMAILKLQQGVRWPGQAIVYTTSMTIRQ